MEEREIFSGIAALITDKPKYEFTIKIANPKTPVRPKRTFLDWIRRKPLPPLPPVETERHFVINPCKVGNMYRAAGAAIGLPEEIREGGLAETMIPELDKHLGTIVYIVAAAIQNNRNEPSRELLDFIEENFDNIDLFTAFANSIDGLELQSFMNSIVLARGTTTVLKPKANPVDGSELIASHTAV